MIFLFIFPIKFKIFSIISVFTFSISSPLVINPNVSSESDFIPKIILNS